MALGWFSSSSSSQRSSASSSSVSVQQDESDQIRAAISSYPAAREVADGKRRRMTLFTQLLFFILYPQYHHPHPPCVPDEASCRRRVCQVSVTAADDAVKLSPFTRPRLGGFLTPEGLDASVVAEGRQTNRNESRSDLRPGHGVHLSDSV